MMSTTSSLAAVASRINERNNALRSELATLEILRSEEDAAKKVFDAEEKSTREVRQELLAASLRRHGLELECLRKKGEVAIIDEATFRMQSEIDNIHEQTKELQRKFDEEQVPVYAAHDIATKAYLLKSDVTLERAQTKKRRREEKKTFLLEQTKRQHEETARMREEHKRLRERIQEMGQLEEEEDEDLVALHNQIKSVLEKKSSLRASLKEAEEVLRQAAENRDNWERRCVEASQ
jgi:DNA repair exonuclease SbcCD ATPase subunit